MMRPGAGFNIGQEVDSQEIGADTGELVEATGLTRTTAVTDAYRG